MQATREQMEQMRLLSDGELYMAAQTFLQSYRPPENKQLAGLLEFSRNMNDLQSFAKHQQSRDWGNKSKEHYKAFYSELNKYLQKLRQQVETPPYSLVTQGLTAKAKKDQVEFFAGWLAREFIQHLVAQAQMMIAEEENQKQAGTRRTHA